MKFGWTLALVAGITLGSPALAALVPFDDAWQEQRFSLFSSNHFAFEGETLAVESDGTVSLVWTAVPPRLWDSRHASWRWQVSKGVPATDLTKKGVDDRNLAVYFVFLPERVAQNAEGRDITDLLDEPEVRVLMYVWGGAYREGTILPTPYLGERGRTIVRRSAGTGEAQEAVDLAADYEAAFGAPVQRLVGLAVSADSDDTNTAIAARVSRLRLLP